MKIKYNIFVLSICVKRVGGILTKSIFKDWKMLVAIGVSLAIRIWATINFSQYHDFESSLATYNVALVAMQSIAFICVIGAFAFDGIKAHGGAIFCAMICLVDAILRHFVMGFAFFGERQTILEFAQGIAYMIPDLLLLIFVCSKKRSSTTWIVIGILLILSTICDDYIAPVYQLLPYYTLKDISKFTMIFHVLSGIPHGLIYLFGFMNNAKLIKSTVSHSYLDQYKKERGWQ